MTEPKNASTNPLDVRLTSEVRAKMRKVKLPRETGPRPWGGDKIAFEPAAVPEEHQAEQMKVKKIIDMARLAKRNQKDLIEAKKEHDLQLIKKLAKAFEDIRPKELLKPNSAEASARQLAALQRIKARKVPGVVVAPEDERLALAVASSNNSQILVLNKIVLHKFHDAVGQLSGWDFPFMKQQFEKAGFVVERGERGMSISIGTEDGTIALYQVFAGADAYEDGDTPGVIRKKGYADRTPAVKQRKEYIEDVNGVLTNRLTTRAISYFHLATMLDIDFNQASKEFGESDRPAGQYPRGSGRTFAANAQQFNVNSGAVTTPGNWQDRYEATGGPEEMKESGATGVNVRSRLPLDANSSMNVNERASMQVRNGSGETQTMLSAAQVQRTLPGREDKIIRGNKGERFDETPDNIAIVEVDLLKVKQAGVIFVNQSSEDSHEWKIAYDKYTSATDPTIKRKAKEELDEYIYSGRKNREVTMDEVPNGTITRIKLTNRATLWEGSGLPHNKWIDFNPANLKLLKAHMSPSRLQDLHRQVQDELRQDDLTAQAKL